VKELAAVGPFSMEGYVMRSVAKLVVLAAGVSTAMFLVIGPSASKDQAYLLNCRLMDQTDQIYKRYCNGEKADSKVVCQGDYCFLVITNYASRFGSSAETSLAVGDGPASRENLATGSLSPARTPGGGGNPTNPGTPVE
jgi:hypothetical protein